MHSNREAPLPPWPERAGPVARKPPWIRVKAPLSPEYHDTRRLMRALRLNTVCEEAACPNIGECWKEKHATVMILGRVCTRACTFCNVATGRPSPVDPQEPERVAEAVAALGLHHVVVTSVDRDDLTDGGAGQFAATIRAIRARSPGTTIEVLVPDFLRKEGALATVLAAKPDVLNHNLETVPRLYAAVRPGARYFHSLRLLDEAKRHDPLLFTKSGIMLGLGEERVEVLQVMDDLRAAAVDFLTIGQYLQPTPRHHPVARFVPPEEFAGYKSVALGKGFLLVSASPLTRSSYHAGEDFARLRAARAKALAATEQPLRHAEPQRTARAALYGRAVVSARRRGRALSRVPALVPWRTYLRAPPGPHRRRTRRRLSPFARTLCLARHPRSAAPHRRDLSGRAVRLSQQSLGLHPGRGRLPDRFLCRLRLPLAVAAEGDGGRVRRGRAAHGRRLRKARPRPLRPAFPAHGQQGAHLNVMAGLSRGALLSPPSAATSPPPRESEGRLSIPPRAPSTPVQSTARRGAAYACGRRPRRCRPAPFRRTRRAGPAAPRP